MAAGAALALAAGAAVATWGTSAPPAPPSWERALLADGWVPAQGAATRGEQDGEGFAHFQRTGTDWSGRLRINFDSAEPGRLREAWMVAEALPGKRLAHVDAVDELVEMFDRLDPGIASLAAAARSRPKPNLFWTDYEAHEPGRSLKWTNATTNNDSRQESRVGIRWATDWRR